MKYLKTYEATSEKIKAKPEFKEGDKVMCILAGMILLLYDNTIYIVSKIIKTDEGYMCRITDLDGNTIGGKKQKFYCFRFRLVPEYEWDSLKYNL